MVFWFFRWKNHRHQSAGGEDISQGDTMHDEGLQRGHEATSDLTSVPERRRSRKDMYRKLSRDSKKLEGDPDRQRTYSFSPGRNDSIRVPHDTNRPPVPPLPMKLKSKRRADTEKPDIAPSTRAQRANTQPPESKQDWQRVPTLHKRSGQDLPRRKSSKKRKEEHIREEEIKAMVAEMPARPVVGISNARKTSTRDGRKVRDGSDISLPSAGSIHSSLSGKGEQTSFKVSAFEALAPRPTIRYSGNPRYNPEGARSRKRVSDRLIIPQDRLKANKKIADLADDLDAGELRELLERDQKRREKKKIADAIKSERKLAKRAQNQKEHEATVAQNDIPASSKASPRDVVGSGIASDAAALPGKRKGSTGSEGRRAKRPTELFREDTVHSIKPFIGYQRTSSEQTEEMAPGKEHDESNYELARANTLESANISPPSSPTTRAHQRGASNVSQMMDLPKTKELTSTPGSVTATQPIAITSTSTSRRAPQSHSRLAGSWTSIFKRNAKHKVESTPSSFSNTSRDSMQTAQGPTTGGYTPIRMPPSSLPKRTMSKFREDLPELPLSPPDSRMQSPTTDVVPPIRAYPDKRSSDQHVRYDTPMSGLRSLEMARLREETPTSGHRSIQAPSPELVDILSQSMASVDSEGSWLTGRRGGSKRGSSQLPTQERSIIHESASSLDRRYKEYSESSEELGIAEDEYFSRLSPGPDDQYRIQRQSATVPSSDDEEGGSLMNSPTSENTKWGAVARTPTVVHRDPRAKSREGLLNDFDNASVSDVVGDSPSATKRKSHGVDNIILNEGGIQRATSVDLGKNHVRRVSAGSARLLDVKKTSGETKLSSD